MLRDLRADHVVDYTVRDPTVGGPRYDLVFDVASTLRLRDALRVLKPSGRYTIIGHQHFDTRDRRWLGEIPRMMGLMLRGFVDRRLPRFEDDFESPDDLAQLARYAERGQLRAPLDRTFPLADALTAYRRMVSGRVRGRDVLES